MRQVLSICISSLLILLLAACSSSNVGILDAPQDDNRQGFAVTTEPGIGSFTPSLVVDETTTGVTVNVRAEGAEDLSAAYLHLHYDSSKYTPLGVEVSDFIGNEDETLSLAVTSVAGDVAVGMTQIAGATTPRSGDGLLASISFADGAFAGTKAASSAPTGNHNSVNDLTLTIKPNNMVVLTWSERNIGDYDNNGVVAINDLTPLGQLFGINLGTFMDPIWGSLVDGDGNGELNIADVSPIGANFGNEIVLYHIYTDADGTMYFGSCAYRSDFYVDNKTRVIYTLEISVAGLSSPTFTVRPGVSDSDTATNIGPISNPQTFVVEPGPPGPPLGLVAISGEAIGDASIKTDWAASMSGDVIKYEIERKLSSEGDGAWINVGTTTSSTTQYVDDTATEDAPYDYRVKAIDNENLSSEYSDTASATPWFAPLPAAPENLVAAPGSGSLEVALNWDKPAGVNPTGYTIYRSDVTPDNFVNVGTAAFNETAFVEGGLTEGVLYHYYVTLSVGPTESNPSNEASSQCSAEIQDDISITSITLSKKTQYANGGDADPSVVTVTTDETPDSVAWTANGTPIAGETSLVLNWKPAAGSSPGNVDLECTVTKGAVNDSDKVTVYLCDATIKSSIGDSGYAFVADSFSDMLEPLADGGNTVSGKICGDYVDGDNVVLFNLWRIG